MKNGLHVQADGDKWWYKDDELHRTDGPAVERADGSKVWFLYDQFLGVDDTGFWALWNRLSDEQRNNLNLLMHLPK